MHVYLALIHYPVYNKNGKIVTTCITAMDLHDLARSCQTFGVKKYYVVNPARAQLEFAGRILKLWAKEESYVHNWTRAAALSKVVLKKSLSEVVREIAKKEGKKPVLVATSAKPKDNITFAGLIEKFSLTARRKKGLAPKKVLLLLFGTGWGLTNEMLAECDFVLEPIAGLGKNSYNHLSVRSAAAIILDRLLGNRTEEE